MSLDALRAAGALDALDVHFARSLARMASASDAVQLAAAFANRAPTYGHVCADLRRLRHQIEREVRARYADENRIPSLDALDDLPAPDPWLAELAASPLVRTIDQPTRTPLVLHNESVYLDRYWGLQARLINAIQTRVRRWAKVDVDLLRNGLDRLFPGDTFDRQRLAALLAATRAFTVVVGGPGTGKTTTVVKMLALMLEQARAGHGRWPLRVALVAPTGKAAARLAESVRRTVESGTLPVDQDILTAIPLSASTIHRALGSRPDQVEFKHTAEHPLDVDVLICDEASMVDLALMSRLVDAVPPRAHLVLLGDKDQLTSVEAGAVLGDICAAGNGYAQPLAAALSRLGVTLPQALITDRTQLGVGDATVELTHTWRFGTDSGIGKLARAINGGDSDAALQVLSDAQISDTHQVILPNSNPVDLQAKIGERLIEGFRAVLQASGPQEAIDALQQTRVLCVHRNGPLGVNWTNAWIERWLVEAELIDPQDPDYQGRPVMITRNDTPLSLFNGDVGVVLDHLAYFPANEGIRSFPTGRLPPHETVHAMTVHKSQGSEFDHVIVLLPERPSPILTRELLYTAVTRASKTVTVVGSADVLRAAIKTQVERASGVRELLRDAAVLSG